MHHISIKQRLQNKIDRLFGIDRRDEYGYMAKDAYLAPDVVLFSKKNLFLYEHASIPEGSIILNPMSKFIMKRGSFSSYNLCVCPGNHLIPIGKWKWDVSEELTYEIDKEGNYNKDIVVDEDVWMGINVTLLNGAHIGRGSIVGAGCVVNKDIPPYAVVGGVPARIIKPLFTIDEILRHEEQLYPSQERISKESLKEVFDKYYDH